MLARKNGQRTTDNGQRTTDQRRGVTLVEMLVTVAVLVILMTILVQIFQAATGSVSAAQAYAQLDDRLRRLDGIIRSDLEGATARFTPPLDPALNLGYFEYGENEFADNQGEDSDDYIRFTAKAPPGRPFTGRFWPNYWANSTTGQIFQPVPPGQNTSGNLANFPITITSDYAEIIYFLRNGNLYRRVFLVVPDYQPAIIPSFANLGYANSTTGAPFQPAVINGQSVSWQGVNDLSAHPSPTGPNANATPSALAQAQSTIVLNTLGHLTNRENRAFYPRFANDFLNADPASQQMSTSLPDGLPDDANQDNIPDLYPSLYPGIFSPSTGQLVFAPPLTGNTPGVTVLSSNPGAVFLGFPYIFPGAYSKAQAVATDAYGWIHAPSPYAADSAGNPYQFDTQTALYLQYLNHNPVDLGDNLPTPPTQVAVGQQNIVEAQTWWGFPTWRETLSPNWTDPTVQVNVGPNLVASASPSQPAGLTYASLSIASGVLANPGTDPNLLPPMTTPSSFTGNFSIYRPSQQLYCDAAGQGSVFMGATLWPLTWEDDLIMTNVRSFDVKAYDNTLVGYGDLGWGDDLRQYAAYSSLTGSLIPSYPPFIGNTSGTVLPTIFAWPPINTTTFPTTPVYTTLQTLAHEGRMPPLTIDNRLDAQYPNPTYVSPTVYTPQYSAFQNYSSNIGDDNNGVVRLRRVWDSWSTDYSRAPANAVSTGTGGFPVGPPFSPPVYPSYPPPYPAPLRGLQIQIRVADPTNQRIKSLTIRQDFTDKL